MANNISITHPNDRQVVFDTAFGFEDERLSKIFTITEGPSIEEISGFMARLYNDGPFNGTSSFELVGRTTDLPDQDTTISVWAPRMRIYEDKTMSGFSKWVNRRRCELTIDVPVPTGTAIRRGQYTFVYAGPGSTFIYRR
ncbi:hypothetical protein HYX70_00240 [Candidatus Saccharibacteria bacterium]|nr:hypothetical protein [Candidatus Saccharibacteria bacterium]